MGRVHAQAVAGRPRGAHAVLFRQPARCDAHGQNRRLRVLGEEQSLFRPFEAQAAQGLAQREVRLVERLSADWKRFGERPPHADLLRTLSREYESDHVCVRESTDGAAAGTGKRHVLREPWDQTVGHEPRRHDDGVTYGL